MAIQACEVVETGSLRSPSDHLHPSGVSAAIRLARAKRRVSSPSAMPGGRRSSCTPAPLLADFAIPPRSRYTSISAGVAPVDGALSMVAIWGDGARSVADESPPASKFERGPGLLPVT